jgi:signal transduction histidine kinase
MDPASTAPAPRGLRAILGWRRVLTTVIAATVIGLLDSVTFTTPARVVVGRTLIVGFAALIAFGIFEQWPKRLPRWMARWAIQIMGLAVAIPVTTITYYLVTTPQGESLWHNPARMSGVFVIMMSGLFVAPWIAVASLFRKSELALQTQAMTFAHEKSELERKALDSRLRLLQAQVEPHFLFNTLANVRELVDAGSPQASTVLDSLIAYLRAAVPRLNESTTTLDQELQLVRAYLELMRMRMPDRLQFALQVDADAARVRCPPTTVLTLVENAVRHGIDPSEEGGRIDVRVLVRDGRCVIEVRDSGAGLNAHGKHGTGNGLASLRERLELVFGGDAHLRISSVEPRGAVAEVDFPAQWAIA